MVIDTFGLNFYHAYTEDMEIIKDVFLVTHIHRSV